MVRGRYEELEAGSREAIEKAVDAGDRKTEGHARNTLGVGLAFNGHPQQALHSLEAARWIAEDLRDAEEMCRAYTNMSMVLVGLGRPADAAAVARSGLEAYRQFEIAPCHGGLLAGNAADALARLGRWDEAVEMGVDHLDRPVDSGNADLRLTLARVAIGRGQLERGGRLIDQVRAFDEHDPGSRAALAMLTAELQLAAGRPAYAWRQVEDGRHDARISGDLLLLGELCRLGIRVERARLASGLRPAARAASIATVESLLAEIDGIVAAAGPNERHGEIAALASAARAEGSAALGSTDPALWAASVEAWDACGHQYDAARARVDWAAAILATGGSPATARTALSEAAAVAADLGADPLRAAIDDVVRRSGLTLEPPVRVRATPVRTRAKPARARATPARVPATPARVPATPARVPATPARARATPARVPAKQARVPATPIPPEPVIEQPRPQLALTRRELDVLDLLALGRTDRQIAEQLLMTPKTASGHVQRIIRKLAVGSRAEAASRGRQP
ncbi:MAG TPA: LuxR C-terminal-related transcriptional regulator, partial [Candidatus Limnocylindrales bacterium]